MQHALNDGTCNVRSLRVVSTAENQRSVPRHHGNVLCLDVNYGPMDTVDMSAKGISFIGTGYVPGDQINLWLVSKANERDFVDTVCEVVAVHDGRIAAVFIQRTERLENFILTHIVDPPLIHE